MNKLIDPWAQQALHDKNTLELYGELNSQSEMRFQKHKLNGVSAVCRKMNIRGQLKLKGF